MNNLRKRNICIVEWCCMCKNNWESADHLLLQYDYAQAYGFCCLFVVHWDSSSGWWICWLVGRGDLVNIIVLIHGGLFHCVMWTIWKEWNRRTLFLIRGWALVCGAKTVFIMLHLWLNDCFDLSLLFSLEHFLDLCKFRWLL